MMDVDVVDELREVYKVLIKKSADCSVKGEFTRCVGIACERWGDIRSRQTKEKIMSLVCAIYSKVKGEIPGLVELYDMFLECFDTESCLLPGLLLFNYLPKEKHKSVLLPVLIKYEIENYGGFSQILTPIKQKVRMVQETRGTSSKPNWVAHFLAQLIYLASRQTLNIDFEFFQEKAQEVKDEYVLANLMERMREYIYTMNKQYTLSSERLPFKHEQVERVVKVLIKKCYKLDICGDRSEIEGDMSKLEEKRKLALSQTLCEYVLFSLNYFIDFERAMMEKLSESFGFRSQVHALVCMGQERFFVRLLPACVCPSAIQTHQELVRCFQKAVLICHILSSHMPQDLKGILEVLLFATKKYLKSNRISKEVRSSLVQCFLRLLEVTLQKEVEGDSINLKHTLHMVYRLMNDISDEIPDFLSFSFIDSVMKFNTMRTSVYIRVKEIELLLFIINKSIKKEVESGLAYLPNFLTVLLEYIKSFPVEYRLGVQLSVMEFLQSVLNKSGGKNSLIDGEISALLEKEERSIEDLYRKYSEFELPGKIRYYYHLLMKELAGIPHDEREFDTQLSVRINSKLDMISRLLRSEYTPSDKEQHSPKIMESMKDMKTAEFARMLSSDSYLIQSLMNLKLLSAFHHHFDLAAQCSQYLILVLLYEEFRTESTQLFKENNTSSPFKPSISKDTRSQPGPMIPEGIQTTRKGSDEELILLYIMVDYCKYLYEINDEKLIGWLGLSTSRYRDFEFNKEGSSIGEKYSRWLMSSSFQDLHLLMDQVGRAVCKRHNIGMEGLERQQEEVVERIKANKSCQRHFALYIRYMEWKIRTEEDAYVRASCIKETISSVSCMKENFVSMVYSGKDAWGGEHIESRIRAINSFLGPIKSTSQTMTGLCILMRRVLMTAFEASLCLSMYNLSMKMVKLMKSISNISQSIDDHIVYLQCKTILVKNVHSGSRTIRFLSGVGIGVEEWAREKEGSKKLVERRKDEVVRVMAKYGIKKKKEFIEMVVNAINDKQSEQGRRVANVFANRVHISIISYSVFNIEDSFKEKKLRVSTDHICKMLARKYGDVVEYLFRGGDRRTESAVREVDGFCMEVRRTMESDEWKLDEKTYFMECMSLNVINALLSRINSFDQVQEKICVKASEASYWICVGLGLAKLARENLEMVSHFVYCHWVRSRERAKNKHTSQSDEGDVDFCLTAEELGRMAQASFNPSYDFKRHIKLNSLAMVKTRESYGRESLRRLTIRKVSALKDFYKYSLYFNGKINPPRSYKSTVSGFSQTSSSPVMLVGMYSNILDYSNRETGVCIIFRSDGHNWTYSVMNEVFLSTINSIVKLIVENEDALRRLTIRNENEKINSKEWWNMRNKFEADLESNLGVIDSALGLDSVLFSQAFCFKNGSGSNFTDLIKSQTHTLVEVLGSSGAQSMAKRFSQENSTLYDFLQTQTIGFDTQRTCESQSMSNIPSSDSNRCLFLMIEGPAFLVPFEHLVSVSELKPEIYRIPHVSECPDKCQLYQSYHARTTDIETVRYRSTDFYDEHPPTCYYLLNPSGDLKGTETRMKEYLEKKFLQWKGKIGTEPLASEIARYLKRKCHFL